MEGNKPCTKDEIKLANEEMEQGPTQLDVKQILI